MFLINFSHPLTPEQHTRLECLSGQSIERILDVKTQFSHEYAFTEQARQMVDAIGLTSNQWQTTPLLLNLPGLSVITAVVLAELHGRCGYFPAVLRLQPIPHSIPTKFEVAEILNLQTIRETARHKR